MVMLRRCHTQRKLKLTPEEFDDWIVDFMYRQPQASAQECTSLSDHRMQVYVLPIIIPHDTLSLLESDGVELSSDLAFNSTIDKPTEFTSHWGFASSDLEPTPPIKPGLHQERAVASSFQDENCSDSDVHNGMKRGSSSLHPQRSNKRSKITKHANTKRKSKQPTIRAYQQGKVRGAAEIQRRIWKLPCTPYLQGRSIFVKRQRYQYKSSTMTQQRITMLESISFVWDSHKLAWQQERLKELEDYKKENGHCDVPTTCHKNPPLGRWVKCQRRQHKRFRSGEASNMTLDRIASLDALGFNWKRRH